MTAHKDEPGPSLTRRQLLAGGLSIASSLAAGGVLAQSWRQLAREDLIPGEPPTVRLQPHAWRAAGPAVSFVAVGDNGSGGRQAIAVATRMAQSYEQRPFGLVSMLGDICYYGPIARRFDAVFVKPFRPLIDAGVQFELAVGNHDGSLFFGDDRLAEVEARLRVVGTPARYYRTTHGPVDFFYLDSVALALPGAPERAQLAWLDEALGAATSPWKVVCSHHPVYSSGKHGPTPVLAQLLEPILVRHGVDLVLSGHDHHYERTHPIRGVTYVVSGAGCKLTPVSPNRYAAFAASTLQFLRVEANPDVLVAESVRPNGAILDRFVLRPRRR